MTKCNPLTEKRRNNNPLSEKRRNDIAKFLWARYVLHHGGCVSLKPGAYEQAKKTFRHPFKTIQRIWIDVQNNYDPTNPITCPHISALQRGRTSRHSPTILMSKIKSIRNPSKRKTYTVTFHTLLNEYSYAIKKDALRTTMMKFCGQVRLPNETMWREVQNVTCHDGGWKITVDNVEYNIECLTFATI